MNPWLETIGVILVALLGILLGRAFSALRKPYWVWGYFISTALIVVLIVIKAGDILNFAPAVSWLAEGRSRFVIISLAVTMGLTTPLSRLPNRFERITVCLLMVLVVFWFSVLPFLVPALIKDDLANLKTRIDADGICYQTRDYTCAPAAAVTALKRLGLSGQEGEIAILSHSSPVAGTLPTCLCDALEDRYGSEGLKCQYRRFNSIAQLKEQGVVLAVLKDAFLSDHCVAILKVSDDTVVIADPVIGKKVVSCEQFEKKWRFSGVVLKRDSVQNI